MEDAVELPAQVGSLRIIGYASVEFEPIESESQTRSLREVAASFTSGHRPKHPKLELVAHRLGLMFTRGSPYQACSRC